MMIKTSGRAVLIVATGIFVGFATPSCAATGADDAATATKPASTAKHILPHHRAYVHRKFSRMAHQSASDRKAADNDDSGASNALPSSIANANAQMATAGALTGSTSAMIARANNLLQTASTDQAAAPSLAGAQIVSADELNDVDRALHAAPLPATTAMASADTPDTAPPAPVVASSDESSTWDKTSLIGKIFIAFGGLLTVASAARMFMA